MPRDEVTDVAKESKSSTKKTKKKKKESSDPDVEKSDDKKKKKKKKDKEKPESEKEIIKKKKKKKKIKDGDREVDDYEEEERIDGSSRSAKKKKKEKQEPKTTKKESSDTKSSKKKSSEKKGSKKPSSKKKTKESVIEAPRMPPQDSVDYAEDDDGGVSETSEDRKMKDILSKWNQDDDSSSSASSESSDFSDDEDEQQIRGRTKDELGLEDNALDHILLAAPDFVEAMKEFERMTAMRPSIGGSLKGLGCLTARIGLDKQAYIEIIAPDPDKPGPIGEQLKRMEHGSLTPIHYAIRRTNLADLADDYVPNDLGYTPDRIVMFMAGADGTPKKWEMLFMYGHFHGGAVPFYIDWGECEHPLGTIAQAGALKSFEVTCPAGSKVHTLLKGMKDITVVSGDVVGLEFSFLTSEGKVTFSSENPVGLRFPGADDMNDDELPSEPGPGSSRGDSVHEDSDSSRATSDSDRDLSNDRGDDESDGQVDENDDTSDDSDE
jgi:hypothetical protein